MNKAKIKLYISILLGKYKTEHYEESWTDFWQAMGILIIFVVIHFLSLQVAIFIIKSVI